MEKLEFGYKCKDIITGFEGVVETRCTFISGCDRVKLTGGIKTEDKQWFDVPVLEVIDKIVYERLQEISCNKYDDIDEAKYDFGQLVKDKITNFKGVIIGKSISINGDISYGLAPTYDKESKDNSAIWYDESRIEIIKESKQIESSTNSRRVGGAVPDL